MEGVCVLRQGPRHSIDNIRVALFNIWLCASSVASVYHHRKRQMMNYLIKPNSLLFHTFQTWANHLLISRRLAEYGIYRIENRWIFGSTVVDGGIASTVSSTPQLIASYCITLVTLFATISAVYSFHESVVLYARICNGHHCLTPAQHILENFILWISYLRVEYTFFVQANTYATSHWLSLQCVVHVEMCEILERRTESTDTAAIVVVIMRVRPYPDICAYHTYVRMGTHTTTRRISVSFIVCVAVNRTYDKSQQRHCLQVIIFKLHSLFSSPTLSLSLCSPWRLVGVWHRELK